MRRNRCAGAKAPAPNEAPKGAAPKNGSAKATVAGAVTITGCLEQKDDAFRLKDTEGVDAPKSRSWKSGFLTKHSATVTLVDASTAKLENHVGERFSVTGSLVDQDLQVKTLSRVTPSCD